MTSQKTHDLGPDSFGTVPSHLHESYPEDNSGPGNDTTTMQADDSKTPNPPKTPQRPFLHKPSQLGRPRRSMKPKSFTRKLSEVSRSRQLESVGENYLSQMNHVSVPSHGKVVAPEGDSSPQSSDESWCVARQLREVFGGRFRHGQEPHEVYEVQDDDFVGDSSAGVLRVRLLDKKTRDPTKGRVLTAANGTTSCSQYYASRSSTSSVGDMGAISNGPWSISGVNPTDGEQQIFAMKNHALRVANRSRNREHVLSGHGSVLVNSVTNFVGSSSEKLVQESNDARNNAMILDELRIQERAGFPRIHDVFYYRSSAGTSATELNYSDGPADGANGQELDTDDAGDQTDESFLKTSSTCARGGGETVSEMIISTVMQLAPGGDMFDLAERRRYKTLLDCWPSRNRLYDRDHDHVEKLDHAATTTSNVEGKHFRTHHQRLFYEYELLVITMHALERLAELHEADIEHRDLKKENCVFVRGLPEDFHDFLHRRLQMSGSRLAHQVAPPWAAQGKSSDQANENPATHHGGHRL